MFWSVPTTIWVAESQAWQRKFWLSIFGTATAFIVPSWYRNILKILLPVTQRWVLSCGLNVTEYTAMSGCRLALTAAIGPRDFSQLQ